MSASRHLRRSTSRRGTSARGGLPPWRSRRRGSAGAPPRIVIEHVPRLRGDLRPDWAQPAQPGGSYRVEITGEPSYAVDICLSSRQGDHNHAGLGAPAWRLVNAIPPVVAAPAGIRTTLALPLVTGRGLYSTG